MKVICIDDYDLSGKDVCLTAGKIYDVIKTYHNPSSVYVPEIIYTIDDDGNQRWYGADLFVPLQKWRELRLNELGV